MGLKPLTQLPLDLEFLPALGRDDFMVGACNQAAVHVLESWPNGWDPYPCAIIYGPHGCGKSHLAHMWQIAAQASLITAGEFASMTPEHLLDLKQNVIIDQLELLIGDKECEEKIFHLYNFYLTQPFFILALSHCSPMQLEFELCDLQSRLRSVRSAEIKPPDDELLAQVIVKRLSDQNLKIDAATIDYILTRMERSWEALNQLMDAIRLYATAKQRGEVTKLLVRDVLLSVVQNIAKTE